jgi:hypothetical protein
LDVFYRNAKSRLAQQKQLRHRNNEQYRDEKHARQSASRTQDVAQFMAMCATQR